MDEKAPKARNGSMAGATLIRNAIMGESLSPAEWAAVPERVLCMAAILLFGRFLEHGHKAVDNQTGQVEEI
jgi:hypothetical protein